MVPPRYGIDSMVLMYHFEANLDFGAAATALLAAAEEGRIELVTSTLSLMEVLVLPKRKGAASLIRRYRDFFRAFPNLRTREVDSEVAELAAELRASFHLRSPDALQVATALRDRANAFVSEDRRLPRGLPIPVLRLSEVPL